MKCQMIIVAGGKGKRMGIVTPKQFLIVEGKPLLMHTITRIHRWNSSAKLILVLPAENIEQWFNLCKEYNFDISHTIVEGGDTRWQSVKNGLAFADDEGLIGIHDGVRPLVTNQLLDRCYQQAEQHGNAIPCTKIVDTIRQINDNGSTMCDRNKFVAIQTPQVFQANMLKKIYEMPYNEHFTDDASVAEWYGYNIHLVEGDDKNIKVTTPKDLIYVQSLLNEQTAE